MTSPLQLVVAPELAPHLARALADHLRYCRTNGIPVTDGLAEVQKWAEVVARGLSSPLPLTAGDDGTVLPLILTFNQAADLLGCSVSKVKTLIAAGQLPAVDFGGVRRVRRVDIEAFVERLADGTSFRDGIEGKAAPDPAAASAAAGSGADPPVTVTARPTAVHPEHRSAACST